MQRKIQYYWNQCQEHSPTPLTYVEDNQDGMTCTSCPSHLINGRQITSMPNGGHFQSCYHKCILGLKSKAPPSSSSSLYNQVEKNILVKTMPCN